MKALFVFAHPDDETFATGGTIAMWAKKGYEVGLMCATRGEAGQLGDPPLCTQEELGHVREGELRGAAKILGISQIFFLDLIDGTLDKIPQKEIVDKVVSVLKTEQPDIVVTFDEGGLTNHPDHIAISAAATNAFEEYAAHGEKRVKLYYTAFPQSYLEKLQKAGLGDVSFGGLQATPDAEITLTIDVTDGYPQKVEAFKCHKTQIKDNEKFLDWGKHIDHKLEHFKLVAENKIV